MATVIDPILYNALLQSRQGALARITSGHRVYPTNNCCISGNTVGVYKDPVAILSVSDVDVCTYEPFSVDISKSFSPTSTIQTYSIDWGDGYISNGVWPPAGSISHPGGGYLFSGTYTVILTVTDLLGATGLHAVDVVAIDCDYFIPLGYVPGYPIIPTLYSYQYVYVSSESTANDYYTDAITDSPPAWSSSSSSNDKTIMMPSNVTPRLFGYSKLGVLKEYQNLYLGFPLGAWTTVMTADDIADECGHLLDYWDLGISRMVFSNRPTQEGYGWMIVYIYWTDAGTEHFGVWVLHSQNAWSSVLYAVELFELEDGTDWDDLRAAEVDNLGLAYDSHSSTVYALAGKCPESDGLGAATYDGWWKLWMSQNFGFSYTVVQQDTVTWSATTANPTIDCSFFDVWVPWVSNTYNGGAVFWTCCIVDTANNPVDVEWSNLIYRSLNHGLVATNIGDDGGLTQAVNILKGPWNSLDRVFGARSAFYGKDADQGEIWQWRDGMGWNKFRDTTLATWRDCHNMLIMEQTGYALKSALCYEDPFWVESSTEENKQATLERVQWFTLVYT